MSRKLKITLFLTLLYTGVYAQNPPERVLKIDDLFGLAEQNSKSLSVSRQEIAVSRQGTEIARSARLPEISASIDAGYIGNIAILNPDFSFNEKVPVPHFTNNYGIEASQTLYAGKQVSRTIEKAKLQEQLSMLNFDQDRETIRLLLVGRYLDLYRLFNQRKVYAKNIELARARLKNIQGLHQEGMVTKNDIIRSELQLTDLDVLADEVENNIAIINKELTVSLGLPEDTRIAVDTTITADSLRLSSYSDYLRQAYSSRPAMKANEVNENIAHKNVQLARADKLPVINLYAGEGLSRPYLNALPPQDIYYNVYQAGIRLRYNVSSLYHAKERIHQAEIREHQQKTRSEQVKQQTELDVNAAFIKYNEARNEYARRVKGRQLADDNYRIVEKKYLNQLALLTDILDASSAKLAAELNQSNAGINIVYRWYQLQKAAGAL